MAYWELIAVLVVIVTKEAVGGPPLHFRYPENDFLEIGSKLLETKARLPKTLLPISYKLDITPILDPDDNDFKTANGTVGIRFKCEVATSEIVLNVYEITITDEIKVKNEKTGAEISVTEFTEDKNKQTLTISVKEPLEATSEYTVTIDFVSRVADDRQDGLYLSQYIDPDTGIVKYQAATQFQAVGARRAFPCFDEPSLRAYFTIRIGRQEEDFHSLCNMDLEDTVEMTERKGYVWDVYPQTNVTMPTYLVAIVVSDFTNVTASEESYRKPVNVWGPITDMESSDGTFAAETGAKILQFFEEYLDFEYEMPKMDSVALPVFGPGAMENWGLNLYKIPYLLYSEDESTMHDKWRIASILGHELAHQWFGNLVTFRWWNDIYLSEGFASYFQFVATNAVTPEFEPLERIAMDGFHVGLDFDGGESAVPVRNDDETNLSIGPSQIIYQKGSAIIRMMQGFLTESTLQKGLQKYLKTKQYDSAVQDDLFKELTDQAKADGTFVQFTVKEVMDTWTRQPGFPLVRVAKAGSNRIYISQERFANASNMNLEPHTWYVPIPYITKANPSIDSDSLQPKTWIEPDAIMISHEVETTDEWILANPDIKGHYRVLYDDHFTSLLKAQLDENHTLISPLSRSQLLDDYFKCAYGEYISIDEALGLSTYLNMEDSLAPWSSAFSSIHKILTLVTDSDLREKFYDYMLSKVEPALSRVKITPSEAESPVATLLRTQLLDWACTLDLEDCFTNATSLFDAWMSNDERNPITVDLQPMLYCAAISRGGNKYREFILEKYKDEDVSPRQQSLLLKALACGSEDGMIYDALNLAFSDTAGIRAEDAKMLMQHVAENEHGRQLTLQYIDANVDLVLKNERLGEDAISSVLSTMSNYFASTEQLELIQNYLEKNKDKFTEKLITSIESSIKVIQNNVQWMKIHRPGIQKFLDALGTPNY